MKQIKTTKQLLVFAMTILMLTSCAKDEALSNSLTEREVVELIEANFHPGVGGLISILEDLSSSLVRAVDEEPCNTSHSFTTISELRGTVITADYTSAVAYNIACNPMDVPQIAAFSISTVARYRTASINSNTDGSFTGNVTGLQPSSSTLTVAGNYDRAGTQCLNLNDSKNISSDFSIELIAIEMDKGDSDIESGNGTFSFTGLIEGRNFSHAGSINFEGDNIAIILINGTSYQIEWE